MMIDWDWRLKYQEQPIARWLEGLPDQVARVWREKPHGDLRNWLSVLETLPRFHGLTHRFDQARVSIGSPSDCDEAQRLQLRQSLMQFHPWRKGPFGICGLHIDTEWRSDMKWDRLKPHIKPLQGRIVLDVGCGNGYHLWRMLGEGAELAIGIDPTQLFIMQHAAIRHFMDGDFPAYLFPLGIEDLPADLAAFDTVFSMGVFYHRQSPFAHLNELKGALRRGGELILETLVIDGAEGEVLVPQGRYAKMRNVWFIPSTDTLVAWMKRAGFARIRVVDVTATGFDEQRSTPWMQFESLRDYLDPANPALTLEGYPAPMRAIVLAEKA
ncbi:MAG: tRNA 5-methoxyuridine(34)/uridine 5-oxyacetic acid(34) synthase CmoB [Candidatus Thiodiazotropha sp.]